MTFSRTNENLQVTGCEQPSHSVDLRTESEVTDVPAEPGVDETTESPEEGGLSRRTLLRLGAAGAAGVALTTGRG
ncbi:MAG TPA: hypothetical protein VGP24_06045, partial [Glaciihabitans sp.]|nr:hypothetical protein [Glaciihabitans sp.]